MTPEPPLSCAVCRSHEPLRVWGRIEDLVTREPYTLMECARCGVLRTSPVPADLAPHYATEVGRFMHTKGSRLYGAMRTWCIRRELSRIVDRLPGAVAMDLGCGTGEVAEQLYRQGATVIAADANETPPPALARLARVSYYPMRFDTYELVGFRPSDRPLVVIVRHVLEHLRDPLLFLQRMIAYGASSFYLAVPNVRCLERHVFRRYWYHWDPPRHVWHFHARAMRGLLAAADLHLVKMGYDTMPSVIPSLYRCLRLHGVPAHRLPWLAQRGVLSAALALLNLLLPGNVLWCVAQRRAGSIPA